MILQKNHPQDNVLSYAPRIRPSIGDYEYAYSDRNSNSSSRKASANLIGQYNAQFSEHHYEQPMIVFPSSGQNSPVMNSTTAEKVPFIPPRPASCPKPPSHLTLPRGLDESAFSWCAVTSAGTKISVPQSKVCLTVPRDALVLPQDLYIAVLGKERYRPKLDSRMAAVTSVISVGPANITHCLQKPVVLSIPHVISGGPLCKSRLTVLYCADVDHCDAEWQIVRCDGDHVGESSFDMSVDSTTAHLVTERLGAYVIVANINDLNQISGASSRSSSGCSSLGSPAKSNGSKHHLTLATKQALAGLLDSGDGWRRMAIAMGAEHYTSFIESQKSPTEALLNLWEARGNMDPDPISSLCSLLKNIGYREAADSLKNEL